MPDTGDICPKVGILVITLGSGCVLCKISFGRMLLGIGVTHFVCKGLAFGQEDVIGAVYLVQASEGVHIDPGRAFLLREGGYFGLFV